LVLLRRVLYKIGFFKSVKLNHPVISVGNLTTGGSGKTPFEIYLINLCHKMDLKPLLLSHGYGIGGEKQGIIKGSKLKQGRGLPDEVEMIARKIPGLNIAYGKDRIAVYDSAQSRMEFDLVILDDGFQHLKIKRDLDILLLDSPRPFGSARLLPSGNLREPKRLCDKADLIILNQKGNQKSGSVSEKISSQNPILKAKYDFVEINALKSGEKLAMPLGKELRSGIITAIGDPESFLDIVNNLGVEIIRVFQFRDHHVFSRSDLEHIGNVCADLQIDRLFTTEKDAVKLEKICFEKPEIYVIKIAFKLTGGEDLLRQKIGGIIENVERS